VLVCKHLRPIEYTLSDGSKVYSCLDCYEPLIDAYYTLMTINEAIAEDERRRA
jgi:hypothetical protein